MIPISKRKGLAAHIPSQRLRERSSSSVTFIPLLISQHKLLMLMSRGQRFCCECTQEEWMEISSARSAGVCAGVKGPLHPRAHRPKASNSGLYVTKGKRCMAVGEGGSRKTTASSAA